MHRYECQSIGFEDFHGFLWLSNAPNMENIDWGKYFEISKAKKLFDHFISILNT